MEGFGEGFSADLTPVVGNPPERPAPYEPTSGGKANLFAALALAQDRVKGAALDGTNDFHKYDYASTESILAAAKNACLGLGLSVRPKSNHMRKEGEQYVVKRVVALAHSSGEEDVSEIEWPVVLEQGGRDTSKKRPLDKALASALTTSLGYLVRDIFQIPRPKEEDMDHPSRDAGGKREEEVPDHQIVLNEATGIAKSLIQGGKDKKTLIDDIRTLLGSDKAVGDDGKWSPDLGKPEAEKILAYLRQIAKGREAAARATSPERLANLNRGAKHMLDAGWTKAQIIAAVRAKVGRADAISDDAKWGYLSDEEAGSLLGHMGSIVDRPPTQPAAGSAPAYQQQSGGSSSSSTSLASPGTSAGSNSPQTQQSGSQPSSTQSSSASTGTAGVGAAPAARDKVSRLSDVIARAITSYGVPKAEMVGLVRAWTGNPAAVSDAGAFSATLSEQDFLAIVRNFKAWDAQKVKDQEAKAKGQQQAPPKDDGAAAERAKKAQEAKAMAEAGEALAAWDAQQAKGAAAGAGAGF